MPGSACRSFPDKKYLPRPDFRIAGATEYGNFEAETCFALSGDKVDRDASRGCR